jgi:hypothetical protein
MIELFMTEAVGMPPDFVAPMHSMPMWPAFEAMADTLLYDARILGDYSIPADAMERITVPVLLLDGGSACAPWIRSGLDALAATLSHVERRTLDGQQHNVEAGAMAAALTDAFAHGREQ